MLGDYEVFQRCVSAWDRCDVTRATQFESGTGVTCAIELDRDTFLKRTLPMEPVELDELQQAFRYKALGKVKIVGAK